MKADKYVPKIGDYLCLSKKGKSEKFPYKVIDVSDSKIGIQSCDVVHHETYTVKDNPMGEIVVLTWDSKLGWVWKKHKRDEDPDVATFYAFEKK